MIGVMRDDLMAVVTAAEGGGHGWLNLNV